MTELRHRNIAHLWADKRIMRFFRKNFNKKHYKNLRSIYLALCEIDSDFGEGIEIKSLTKTVATYAGINKETAGKYLKALKKANIIDYYQVNKEGKFGGSILLLYKWNETRTEKAIKIINKFLEQEKTEENPLTEKPVNGKPANGKIDSFKNNKLSNNKNKYILYLNNNKNPKGSISLSEEKSSDNVSINDTSPSQDNIVLEGSSSKSNKKYHECLPFAQQLSEIIQSNKNIKHTPKQIDSWARQIYRLHSSGGISLERIQDALNWYAEHIGEQYVPVIESGTSFREKFIKLESAIERSTSTRPSKKTNRIGYDGQYKKIKGKVFRSEIGDEND